MTEVECARACMYVCMYVCICIRARSLEAKRRVGEPEREVTRVLPLPILERDCKPRPVSQKTHGG